MTQLGLFKTLLIQSEVSCHKCCDNCVDLRLISKLTLLGYRNHLTKRHFKTCNLETPLMRSVIEANKHVNKLVCDEVDRVRFERGETLLQVEQWVKQNGGLICRQSFRKYQLGEYYTTSNTFLNLMARYCDYKNFGDLLYFVFARERGMSNVA